MAKKVYSKKEAANNTNWRKKDTRGRAKNRKNYNGLLRQLRQAHQTMVKESLSALCHATI